jgi:hypothetical protein
MASVPDSVFEAGDRRVEPRSDGLLQGPQRVGFGAHALHPARLLEPRPLARRERNLEVVDGPVQAIDGGGNVARFRLGLIVHIGLRLPNVAANRKLRVDFPARQRRWRRKKPLTDPRDLTIVRPETNERRLPRVFFRYARR